MISYKYGTHGVQLGHEYDEIFKNTGSTLNNAEFHNLDLFFLDFVGCFKFLIIRFIEILNYELWNQLQFK